MLYHKARFNGSPINFIERRKPMFEWINTVPTMTSEQMKAKEEAIRLLTKAQKILMDDDGNVLEAEQLRFKVTTELLPPKHLYILGKHPHSLLTDVDTRIKHAYFRLNQDGILPLAFTMDDPQNPLNKRKQNTLKKDKFLIVRKTIIDGYSNSSKEWKIPLISLGGFLLFFAIIYMLNFSA